MEVVGRGGAGEHEAMLALLGKGEDGFCGEGARITEAGAFVDHEHERLRQEAAFFEQPLTRGADEQLVIDKEDIGGAVVAGEATPGEDCERLNIRAPCGVDNREGTDDEQP